MTKLLTFAFLTINFARSFAQDHPSHNTNPCRTGFFQIGNFCYKYNNVPSLSFGEANLYCKRFRAQVAEISPDDATSDVITLIRRHGYRERNYWVKVAQNNDVLAVRESRSAVRCSVVGQSTGYVMRPVSCSGRHMPVCQHEARISTTAQRGKGGFCFGKYGYYPHPDGCGRYIFCYNGRKFNFRCQREQLFSSRLRRCVQATNFLKLTPQGGDPAEEEPDTGSSDSDTSNHCETGYRKHNSKCYKVLRRSVSWVDASNTCVNVEKGSLVSIKNCRVMLFLKKLIKNTRQSYWIGLNDKLTSDTYVWSDGEVLSRDHYDDWAKRSRKRSRASKECVKLDRRAKFRWMDAVCSERNYFICEKDSWKQPSSECGTLHKSWPNDPDIQALVGGTPAHEESHPWQVSLRFEGDLKCGGSLIDSCWVLTAAHCVTLPDVPNGQEPTEAVLRDYNLVSGESSEVRLRIQKIFVHPDWSFVPVPNNDIAVLKLEECSSLHNPICMPPSRDFSLAAGTECYIAGYGTIHPTRRVYPDRLMEATVPLIEERKCKSLYAKRRNRRKSVITDAMFCAGFLEGKVDACQGDSGGPLTCHNPTSDKITQWGIVSWGIGCAVANQPGVYTKVSHFYEWIRNTTKINF